MVNQHEMKWLNEIGYKYIGLWQKHELV